MSKAIFTLLLIGFIKPVMAEQTAENSHLPEATELWMRAAPPNARMLAAYVTVTNNTPQDLHLTGAFAPDFAMAEIHKTVEIDGMLKMREQKKMALPMQSSVIMEPGGIHIMLMMPEKQFKVGEQVRICLVYQDPSGNELVQHLDFPVMKK